MVRYSTFEYQYPSLYNIVRRKQATVATVLESTPLNVSFRRALVGDKLLEWNNLVSRLVNITLSESGETDTFIWGLTNRGVYSVRSFYNFLVNTDVRITNREIWRMKIPLKIKIFMWYIRIIYLVETGGVVNYAAFCSFNESIQHLFFECPYAKFLWRIVHIAFNISPPINMGDMFNFWGVNLGYANRHHLLAGAAALFWALWLSRNEIVFDNSRPKTFLQVLFKGTHWLRQWAQLQRNEDHSKILISACSSLETTAMQIFTSHGWSFTHRIGL